MRPRQLLIPGPITKQSNALCRSQIQSASAIGFRVAVMVASMIRETDNDFHEYEISPAILMKYNLSTDDTARMHKAMDTIAQTTVNILDGTLYEVFPLFGRARYDSATKKATVILNSAIKQHYLQIKSHYTRIPVMEYIHLTSAYTQKLFEYLLSWRSVNQKSIETIELYELLGVPDTYYLDFYQFRRKILDPAFKQIKKYTSLLVEYETHSITGGRGKGKKVTHINFIFDADLIHKMKTPAYKFQRLSKTRQNALHREFKATFDALPKGLVKSFQWLKDPLCDVYKESFKAYLNSRKDI